MKIETIRHSLSHILAFAVQELFPDTLFGIGPAIEGGFYYDFDFKKSITSDDLSTIEKKMKQLIKEGVIFKKKKVPKEKAKTIFKNQPYKLELINELPDEEISIYESGKFTDLCRGPHVKSTKEILNDIFRLTKIAGAYWRGSEKNPMLTRIYGVAFKNKKELERYLKLQEEAEKRDHRKLGKDLELFIFDEEVGAGLSLWLPKGAILIKIIKDFLTQELLKEGYELVSTPHIGKEKLFETSGHLDFYKENMYSPIEVENEKYYLKPMNCPHHIRMYKTKIRSYRDLPIRWAEFGTVYRFEKSGVLHGLVRVRGLTQDDAHIWCAPEQLSDELVKTLKFALRILKIFGFKDFNLYLSTRPEKYIGTLKMWQKAEKSLEYAFKKVKVKYQVRKKGGAFYGPKIDIEIKDALERLWQCTTIQLDFNLPERLDMTYINRNGKKKKPIMIHRTLIGAFERFIGILLEYYNGALPLWLSPEQIWIIPVGSRHRKYAQKIAQKIYEAGSRNEVKDGAETVSKKIREGELQKIPYLLVVGDEEVKAESVRVRERKRGDTGPMKIEKFLEKIKLEIKKKEVKMPKK